MIAPLEDCEDFSEDIKLQISQNIDYLTNQLLKAQHWYRSKLSNQQGAPRILLWGVDAIAQFKNGKINMWFLEINVHPQLFRKNDRCNLLVDDMLATEYLDEMNFMMDNKLAYNEWTQHSYIVVSNDT